jgi:hypothetical protein
MTSCKFCSESGPGQPRFTEPSKTLAYVFVRGHYFLPLSRRRALLPGVARSAAPSRHQAKLELAKGNDAIRPHTPRAG